MDDSSMGFSLTNRSLDEAKLSADDAEAYVLQWLSSAARFLNIASVENVKSVQHDLEATLLDVLTSPRPQFPPGRPLRNLVAKCFITIYTRGESKTLFDTLIALMKVTGDFKAPVEKDTQKIASLHCIGELMASFGAKVTSVMAEVATTTMKLYRSSNSIVLRYHAINTLRKALTNARRAVPESLARDILKQMKSALNEKALPIRRAASEVLAVMYPLSGHEWSASEIEHIMTLCIRSLESSDQITRHSLAQLVAKVLSSSQTEVPVSVSDNSKKPKNEEEDDESIPGAVPPGEVKTILTCTEMLSQLSTPFNKPHTSHKTRVGIFDFYSALLTVLGPSFVETNYATIVQHLMSEIVTNTRNFSNRYEVLLIRKLVGILLRDLIGVRLLNEQAQIAAIQELSNLFLKRWPALLHGQVAPSPHVLAIVLKEVAGLLQQLGNAPPPVQDALSEPLTTLLAHPNHTVRVHASWTLRIFCCASPLRMPKIIFDVQELLQRDINLMTSQSGSSDISTRALGHAYGLAALVTVIPEKPLYVSYDISAKVLDMAIQLLKRAGDHDLQVSGLEIEIAWTCIASLMTLGVDDLAAVADSLNRDSIEVMIDELLRKPILRSCEHDTLSVCQPQFFELDAKWPESPPPSTATVDAALQLFARLLPQQDLSVASRLVTQLTESARSSKFDKNVGRKAAASINVTIAVTLALREASASSTRQVRDVFGHVQMTSPLSAILKVRSRFLLVVSSADMQQQDALTDGDPVLRLASCEAIGLLAGLADSVFLASQMKSLVDEVVNNRDPFVRAGCALALGSIFDHVGSLAAGPLLKTTVNIIMSLSKDAHPVVHFWSLQSLSRVVNAASLTYAPYVGPTLGMLLSIYMLESHEPEGGSLANANAKGDLPAYQVSCRIIDAVISILGPDIQESTRTRQLILDLVQLFMNEQDEGIQVEAIKCIQHFLMFAPEHVPVPELVDRFRTHLNSSRRPLKLASINALYQLVQKDALLISKVGGDRLVEDLFGMLDGDPSIEGVRKVISSWLQQTVTYNPSAWIDLCQKIMSRTTASQQILDAAAKGAASFDDEGESLNAGGGGTSNTNHLTSRWRTQLFALQCLHDICINIASSGRVEQLDLVIARRLGAPTAGLLVSRIADLIKMAFAASTAHVTEIRLEGLVVLRDVIEIFAKAADPDYEDALLLEQYQAPITAALTPAFTADSTPEILASAIGACAVFVGCGVVKDISRMGRILKLLTSALEQCKGPGMLSLGGATEASPNASAMLRIATLSAWAELAAGSERPYLREVVKPYRSTLATLWVAALRDYASIRAGSEVSQDTSSAPLDTAFASLGKDILLPYYATSWPIILKAISVAMEAHDPFIRGAMDGIDTPEASQVNGSEKTIYKDPVSLFFVVFGLVYEALSTTANSTSAGQNNLSLVALRAMKNLVRPEYAGRALLEPTLFDELLSACEVADEARAVAISLYADLLKDETSEDDYASPTLPSLMALISQPCETPEKVEKFSQLIHGLLSACIVNIDEMKGRQGAISSKKIKCNFLAAVLVLTVVPQSVKVGRAVVERCCFLISEKLSVADETTLTAAHCAKTLLVASASGNRMLRHCAKMLLPGIISFVAKCASSSRDQPDSSRAAAIGEILKALGALLSTVVDDLRVRVLGVVLPVITLLLDPSEAPASGVQRRNVKA
ncbi:hypothetical protein EWM64_g4165 [Hericium alpestre]|uniref:LAA1-like C-terminal TPR repeats domain-containing protein n=1 Tax=Hericium alpestre TaxID=135208 RepID=A0A4Z0A0I8_9AGAM|nr:hypothetical protein EWM64_g4165 [Hericium alpestre]